MIKKLEFKMYHAQFTFCLLVSFFALTSCKHENEIKDASPYFTGFYNNNENSILRDINFNMTPDEVKKIETSKLYETTADHLFYEFSYPTDSTAFSEYANVEYFFNENNQLDIITTEIYLNDTIQQAKLNNTLTQYLDKRYSKSEKSADNYNVWTGLFKDKTSNKKYDYTVSLKNLEDDNGVRIEYYLQR